MEEMVIGFSRRILYKRRTRTTGERSIVRKIRFTKRKLIWRNTTLAAEKEKEDRNVNLIENAPLKLHWGKKAAPREADANGEN